jgi:hypothetical protein
MSDPYLPANDIEQLKRDHPRWLIGSVWASAASGPDARRLVAVRDGIQVHAWTAAELSRLISHEDAAQADPPG